MGKSTEITEVIGSGAAFSEKEMKDYLSKKIQTKVDEIETERQIANLFDPEFYEQLVYRNDGRNPLLLDIAYDVQMYLKVLEIGLSSARVNLTRYEEAAILDATKSLVWDAFSLPELLDLGISFRIAGTPGLAEKWEIDAHALIDKLDSLEGMETLALLDWSEKYWRNCSNIDLMDFV